MKEIICPYLWDCGKKIEQQELSQYDYDFLKSASEKKMTFMIIHCPYCLREFKFDTVQWKANMFGCSDPNIVAKKNKKTTKQLNNILNKAKIEIPVLYFDYLISERFSPEVSVFQDEGKFCLYDLNQLCEKIDIDGKPYLTINQLKGFTTTLLETVDEMFTNLEDLDYNDISSFLTIGSENTRLLCIDHRDYNSLWVFHPDGGDVEKLSLTLNNLIKQ